VPHVRAQAPGAVLQRPSNSTSAVKFILTPRVTAFGFLLQHECGEETAGRKEPRAARRGNESGLGRLRRVTYLTSTNGIHCSAHRHRQHVGPHCSIAQSSCWFTATRRVVAGNREHHRRLLSSRCFGQARSRGARFFSTPRIILWVPFLNGSR
jgi:hypothetical protein